MDKLNVAASGLSTTTPDGWKVTITDLFSDTNRCFIGATVEAPTGTVLDRSDYNLTLTRKQLLTIARTLKDTPKPDCRYLDPLYQKMQSRVDEALAACERVQQMIKSGQNQNDILKAIYEVGDGTKGPAFLCLDSASNILRFYTAKSQPFSKAGFLFFGDSLKRHFLLYSLTSCRAPMPPD